MASSMPDLRAGEQNRVPTPVSFQSNGMADKQIKTQINSQARCLGLSRRNQVVHLVGLNLCCTSDRLWSFSKCRYQHIPSGLNQNFWVWVKSCPGNSDEHSWLNTTATVICCSDSIVIMYYESSGEPLETLRLGSRPTRLESVGWDPGTSTF